MQGGNCTIKGLVINNFTNANGINGIANEAGIWLESGPGDLVQDCYIGTGANGLVAAGNAGNGVRVTANSCTVGGTGVTQRNVLSGNGGYGISVTNANRLVAEGNYIGLGADGTTIVANGNGGIYLDNSVGDQIGGTAAGAGNVISGKTFEGIFIFVGGSTGDVIQGNYIGTDATGTVAEPNGSDGILNQAAASVTIGGIGNAGNVISGNGGAGILLLGTQVTNNLISGNRIGVAATGSTAVPNKGAGVFVQGAINDVIGGANINLGNIIANNGLSGNEAGVNVLAGENIEILSNSIVNNANGGIFLSPGSNAPDGTNTQSAPIISSVETAAGQTDIVGTISASPSTGANSNFTVQFFTNAGTSPDPAGLFEGQTLIGETTVTTDVNGNGTFSLRLPVGTNVGDVLTATATQDVIQATSRFSDGVVIAPAPTTDLKVTNATSANPLLFGNNETYTVTIANIGTTDDTNVVYTGVLDNNSTFVSAMASQLADPTMPPAYSNGTVTANLGTIAAGTSVTVTIVVTPLTTGNISLTSTAIGDVIDLTPGNNTNVLTTVPVNPAADLQVQINSNPNPVAVGSNLAYVVTIINNGPNDATNVVATDTLPASVSIVDVNTSQGSFTENGNEVDFQLGDVPAQGAVTITIDVTPNQDGQITDTATTMSPDVADPDPTNNSQTNTTTVQKAVNLALSASASPVPGTTAQPLTFNLSVSNGALAGTTISPATAVVVTDTLPANIDPNNITVTLSQGSATILKGVVTINFGTIGVGQPPATASIKVFPLSSGVYTNTATVSDSAEINVGTAPATVTTPVPVSPSDLAVTVVANPSTATINGPLTYTVTVTNNGPADAPGVVLVDLLPSSIMANPAFSASQLADPTKPPTIANGKITANLGTILSGHQATMTIVVVPTLSGPINDIAGTASANYDPNTANNLVTNTTLVSPVDLIVKGIASTKTPIQGDALVYGFTVYNAGPAPSAGTGINIALPANSSFVSSFSTEGFTGFSTAFNILSAAIGSLAPEHVRHGLRDGHPDRGRVVQRGRHRVDHELQHERGEQRRGRHKQRDEPPGHVRPLGVELRGPRDRWHDPDHDRPAQRHARRDRCLVRDGRGLGRRGRELHPRLGHPSLRRRPDVGDGPRARSSMTRRSRPTSTSSSPSPASTTAPRLARRPRRT